MFWNSGKNKDKDGADDTATPKKPLTEKQIRKELLKAEYAKIKQEMLGGGPEANDNSNHSGLDRGLGNSANRSHMGQSTGAQSVLNRGLGDSANRDRFGQAASGITPVLNRGLGDSANRNRFGQTSESNGTSILNGVLGDSPNRNRFGQATKIITDSSGMDGVSEKKDSEAPCPKLTRFI